MVRGGYPEIARSTFAAVAKTELESDGHVYVTRRRSAAPTAQAIEALYEMVWEDGLADQRRGHPARRRAHLSATPHPGPLP